MFRHHKSPDGLAEEIYPFFLYQCCTVLKKKLGYFLSVTTRDKASKCWKQVPLSMLCQWECSLVDREQVVISKRSTWCGMRQYFFQRILIDNQFGVPSRRVLIRLS